MPRLAVVCVALWLLLYAGHAPHVLDAHAAGAMDAAVVLTVGSPDGPVLAGTAQAAHCLVEAVVRPSRGGTTVLGSAATADFVAFGRLVEGCAARAPTGRARPPPTPASLQVYLL